MKAKTCGILLILLAGIFFSLQACGGSEQSAQAGDSFIIESKTSEKLDQWPAGATVEIYLTEVQDSVGQTIEVVVVEVSGTDEILSVSIGDMYPRLTEDSGGAYAGPRFQMDDGSMWTIGTELNLDFSRFKQTEYGWMSIAPLEWICQKDSIRRFSISLVSNSFRIKLLTDEEYLIAGNGFEKYLPAAHGASIELKCY